MAIGGFYKTGTASVASGSKTVSLFGALTTQFEVGDSFFAGSAVGLIESITDDTHFELALPWAGSTLSGGAYVVQFLAPSRYEAAYTGMKLRELLTRLDGIGIIYYVPAGQTQPDVAVGDEGDFAIRIVPGAAWTFWVKQSGVWTALGAPLGVAWKSVWSSGQAYVANDIVSRLGVTYIALLPGTNHPPESSPTYWEVLLQGGNRYDLLWSDSDMPASGETIIRIVMTTTVTFPAGMGASKAIAQVAPTASAVFSLRKNGVEFATYTFAAGQTTATFSCPTQTVFAPGDVYSEHAPAPRDSTLFGVSSTKTAYRS